jgi:hypothetical protein
MSLRELVSKTNITGIIALIIIVFGFLYLFLQGDNQTVNNLMIMAATFYFTINIKKE